MCPVLCMNVLKDHFATKGHECEHTQQGHQLSLILPPGCHAFNVCLELEDHTAESIIEAAYTAHSANKGSISQK